MTFPEEHRWKNAPHGYATSQGQPFGAFIIPAKVAGRTLKVIACDGEETGWEHVSVSLGDRPDRCPSWDEMCLVKSLFWSDEESVVQFHPPKSEYVNAHSGCLHLWKCVNQQFPIPPSILVGPKTAVPIV